MFVDPQNMERESSSRLESARLRLAVAESEWNRRREAHEQRAQHARWKKQAIEMEQKRRLTDRIQREELMVLTAKQQQALHREQRARETEEKHRAQAAAAAHMARVSAQSAADREAAIKKEVESATQRHERMIREKQIRVGELAQAREEAISARREHLETLRAAQATARAQSEDSRYANRFAMQENSQERRRQYLQQHDARLQSARLRSEAAKRQEVESMRQRQQQEAERHQQFQLQRQLAFEERLQANYSKEQRRKALIQHAETVRRMREERYLREFNEALEIGALMKQQNSRIHLV
jgi:hypothetical protein